MYMAPCYTNNENLKMNTVVINSLQPGVAFLYPLKTSENLKATLEKQHWALLGECEKYNFGVFCG